jgi:16S rRNA (cytosine967-C5)-methyltransferase
VTDSTRERNQGVQARVTAVQVIVKVLQGRYLDDALAEVRREKNYTPLVQELAYGTLRWYHRLDGIAALFLQRPLKAKDQDIHVLLLTGLYQLAYMRLAPHAAVDLTVAACAALKKDWAKGLINACLRSAQRETSRVNSAVNEQVDLRYSHPGWLVARLRDDHPRHWEEILEANNERPPLTLRINQQRTSREAYLRQLSEASCPGHAHATVPTAVVLDTPVPVEQLPGFSDGYVSVQDAAAQLAALMLDAQPGERVLDACAAPGGKTAHILEQTPGLAELWAVEVDAERSARLQHGLARLGLSARVIVADASKPAGWWDGVPFDRILVDAPCSATGVIRRHPDIKVRRLAADLGRLTDTQARVLDGVWPCLKPGGKLWYATCSVLRAENQQQIEDFLRRHPDAGLAGERQILPGEEEMDGFYYACLHKS